MQARQPQRRSARLFSSGAPQFPLTLMQAGTSFALEEAAAPVPQIGERNLSRTGACVVRMIASRRLMAFVQPVEGRNSRH
jgi:hypothetical protein